MLAKILSGGLTGAGQAGHDIAIKLKIPHGRWVAKGWLTDNDPLPEHFLHKKMSSDSNPKSTEQNVIDSAGTVIFSHGKLSGRSALTIKFAQKHAKPWLHLDMKNMSIIYAGRLLRSWIIDNGLKTVYGF